MRGSRSRFGGSVGVAVALAMILIPAGAAEAQVGPIVLSVSDATTGLGQELSISVNLSHEKTALGWSYEICHDPTQLELVSAGLGADGAVVNGGAPPDFYNLVLYPDGWTLGVVINLMGFESLGPGDYEIGNATYTALAEGSSEICPCDTLDPLNAVVIVYDGASLVPDQVCGTATVLPEPVPEYRRGDANVDGLIDIADGVFILYHLFAAGPEPPCHDAADVNGDGDMDVADGVGLLGYLFASGPEPVAPFPECAPVFGADCDTFGVCP